MTLHRLWCLLGEGKKCLKKYVKNIVASAYPESFKRKLFEFGQENTAVITTRRMKKTTTLVPTQSTSRARRLRKSSGKSSSTYGRKPKECDPKVELEVTENEKLVFHSFSVNKSRQKCKVHSLSNAVDKNSQNEKRHKH